MTAKPQVGIQLQVLDDSRGQLLRRSASRFLLRLQEAVKPTDDSSAGIEMGTRTVTEVLRETADADPHSLNNYPISRED